MALIESPIAQDPLPKVDEQLDKIESQLENLLRKDGSASPIVESPLDSSRSATPPVLPPLAPHSTRRRITAKKLIRPALGLGLLALAAWAMLPLLFDLRSTQAVVNAPLVTLRSPIEGRVNFLGSTTIGTIAKAKAPLFDVKNPLADDDRLDALKDEKTYLEARIKGFRQQLTSLTELQENLSSSAREYQEARLRTLAIECEEARSKLENARSVEKQRESEKGQLAQLRSSHNVSGLDADAARFAAEAARHGVVQAQKNLENLEEQVRSLRSGVHIGPGDGRNDLPYSAQRLHELQFRVAEIRASIVEDEAKLAQLGRHMQAEKERISHRAEFTSAAPKQSIIWRRHVGSDTIAGADSPLLDVIDPAEIFIDAIVCENDLKRVKIGDTAQVRLAGSRKQWKAVVKGVFGRSLPWPDRLLAVEAVPAGKQEVHVVLRFDEPVVDEEAAPSMPVGQAAEVTFISTGDAMKRLCGF